MSVSFLLAYLLNSMAQSDSDTRRVCFIATPNFEYFLLDLRARLKSPHRLRLAHRSTLANFNANCYELIQDLRLSSMAPL